MGIRGSKKKRSGPDSVDDVVDLQAGATGDDLEHAADQRWSKGLPIVAATDDGCSELSEVDLSDDSVSSGVSEAGGGKAHHVYGAGMVGSTLGQTAGTLGQTDVVHVRDRLRLLKGRKFKRDVWQQPTEVDDPGRRDARADSRSVVEVFTGPDELLPSSNDPPPTTMSEQNVASDRVASEHGGVSETGQGGPQRPARDQPQDGSGKPSRQLVAYDSFDQESEPIRLVPSLIPRRSTDKGHPSDEGLLASVVKAGSDDVVTLDRRMDGYDALGVSTPRTRRGSAVASEGEESESDSRSVQLNHNPNTVLSFQYKKGPLLGSGSFGNVYSVLNTQSGELMALKEVPLPSVWLQAKGEGMGARGFLSRKVTGNGRRCPRCSKPLGGDSERSPGLVRDGVEQTSNSNEGEAFCVCVAKGDAEVKQNQELARKVRMIEQEINLLRSMRHPNIVRYLGVELTSETLNIFTELVSGGTIPEIMKLFGPIEEATARVYTRQILQGLLYLHRHSIIHRDIKGSNILIDSTGQIKLADFGASTRLEEIRQVTAPSIRGSPYWMAPEVIRQEQYGKGVDVWGLGCTVIEMLTGRHPWGDQFTTVLSLLFHIATSNDIPQIPKDRQVSQQAREFVGLCLRRDPSQRPSVEQLLKHPFVTETLTTTPSDLSSAAGEDAAGEVKRQQQLTQHTVLEKTVVDVSGVVSRGSRSPSAAGNGSDSTHTHMVTHAHMDAVLSADGFPKRREVSVSQAAVSASSLEVISQTMQGQSRLVAQQHVVVTESSATELPQGLHESQTGADAGGMIGMAAGSGASSPALHMADTPLDSRYGRDNPFVHFNQSPSELRSAQDTPTAQFASGKAAARRAPAPTLPSFSKQLATAAVKCENGRSATGSSSHGAGGGSGGRGLGGVSPGSSMDGLSAGEQAGGFSTSPVHRGADTHDGGIDENLLSAIETGNYDALSSLLNVDIGFSSPLAGSAQPHSPHTPTHTITRRPQSQGHAVVSDGDEVHSFNHAAQNSSHAVNNPYAEIDAYLAGDGDLMSSSLSQEADSRIGTSGKSGPESPRTSSRSSKSSRHGMLSNSGISRVMTTGGVMTAGGVQSRMVGHSPLRRGGLGRAGLSSSPRTRRSPSPEKGSSGLFGPVGGTGRSRGKSPGQSKRQYRGNYRGVEAGDSQNGPPVTAGGGTGRRQQQPRFGPSRSPAPSSSSSGSRVQRPTSQIFAQGGMEGVHRRPTGRRKPLGARRKDGNGLTGGSRFTQRTSEATRRSGGVKKPGKSSVLNGMSNGRGRSHGRYFPGKKGNQRIHDLFDD